MRACGCGEECDCVERKVGLSPAQLDADTEIASKPFFILSTPPGMSDGGAERQRMAFHDRFTDEAERDEELDRLRKTQPGMTWVARNPQDSQRTDSRRTL